MMDFQKNLKETVQKAEPDLHKVEVSRRGNLIEYVEKCTSDFMHYTEKLALIKCIMPTDFS